MFIGSCSAIRNNPCDSHGYDAHVNHDKPDGRKNIMAPAPPVCMDENAGDEISEMVHARFTVSETIRDTYIMEFRIEDWDYSERFADLARELDGSPYVGRLVKRQGGIYVTVQKFIASKPGRIMSSSWTPRILFGVVCIFVMIDGYYRTAMANQLAYVGEPIQMAVLYTLALLGILGVHEAGHLVAARFHRLKTTWPFFIPGLPILGIPTFGAFIRSSALTINRRILFDVAIAGPVAGAVVAIIVALAGAWSAPFLDEQTAGMLRDRGILFEFQFGEPLLLYGALEVFGKNSDGIVVLTPVLWASWIGFLITFLNLLPAWQLDGGHMSRTMLGARPHMYATFGSMAVLVLLNYWVMALLILALSMRNPAATPMDEVTPLPRNRRIAYAGVAVLAVVCAPLPSGLLP